MAKRLPGNYLPRHAWNSRASFLYWPTGLGGIALFKAKIASGGAASPSDISSFEARYHFGCASACLSGMDALFLSGQLARHRRGFTPLAFSPVERFRSPILASSGALA